MMATCYHRRVIVDSHTHIFPPEIAEQRESFLLQDATFRAMYANPKATMATSEELLQSMHDAGVDVSVALGFAWNDAATCRRHNDYLIEAASKSDGRIVPFCTLPLAAGIEVIEAEMRRCADQGVRGFGELRPDSVDFELDGEGGARLAAVAMELGATLSFHVSEPVGHAYAGKEGLDVGRFYRFVTAHPELHLIGAHWAGGLPFYSAMPEVAKAFEAGTYVDTAASSLLYGDAIYERGAGLIGAERILFGSDYPLLNQKRSKRRIDESGLDVAAKARILGENAAKLLALP